MKLEDVYMHQHDEHQHQQLQPQQSQQLHPNFRCDNNNCVPACNVNSVPQGSFLSYDSYWKEGLGSTDVAGRIQKFGLLACKKSGEKLIASQVFILTILYPSYYLG